MVRRMPTDTQQTASSSSHIKPLSMLDGRSRSKRRSIRHRSWPCSAAVGFGCWVVLLSATSISSSTVGSRPVVVMDHSSLASSNSLSFPLQLAFTHVRGAHPFAYPFATFDERITFISPRPPRTRRRGSSLEESLLQIRGGAAADDGEANEDDNNDSSFRNKELNSSSNQNESNEMGGLLAAATVLETTTTTLLESGDDDGLSISTASTTNAQADPDSSHNDSSLKLDISDERESPVGGTSWDDTTLLAEEVNDNEDGVDHDDDDTTTLSTIDQLEEEASELRAKGKEQHDEGLFEAAAESFRMAATRLKSGDDFATCRLHEALCRLKAGGSNQAQQAVAACDDVLQQKDNLPNVLVARAFHRRAKAYMELDQPDEALKDARSAAFLGDRKAVALYGKLLRENPGENGASGGSFGFGDGAPDSSSLLNLLMSASSTTDDSASMPSPLDGPGASTLPSFLPSLFNLSGNKKQDNGSLAKSVLSNLSKRLQDESTQDSICNFLQQTSPLQIQSFASMAGLPLAERQASQLASFCHGITPSTLQRGIRLTQRITYVVRIIQKLVRLIHKYRTILIVLCLLAWIKSALLRPVPLSKAARRAAQQATKAAVGSAITAAMF